MVVRVGDGQAGQSIFSRPDSDRRRALRTGLSLLARDQEGGCGDSLPGRYARIDEALTPVRDDGRGSILRIRRPACEDSVLDDRRGLRDGDDSDRGNDPGREAEGLQAARAGPQEDAGIADVSDGHRTAALPAAAEAAIDGLRKEFSLLSPAEKLGRNLDLSLEHWHEVLIIPYWYRPRGELKIWLDFKHKAGNVTLGAVRQVSDQSLRLRELDALPELIRMIREARGQQDKGPSTFLK